MPKNPLIVLDCGAFNETYDRSINRFGLDFWINKAQKKLQANPDKIQEFQELNDALFQVNVLEILLNQDIDQEYKLESCKDAFNKIPGQEKAFNDISGQPWEKEELLVSETMEHAKHCLHEELSKKAAYNNAVSKLMILVNQTLEIAGHVEDRSSTERLQGGVTLGSRDKPHNGDLFIYSGDQQPKLDEALAALHKETVVTILKNMDPIKTVLSSMKEVSELSLRSTIASECPMTFFHVIAETQPTGNPSISEPPKPTGN